MRRQEVSRPGQPVTTGDGENLRLTLLSLDKLFLDEAVLGEMPLEERLVFRLAESVVHVFHRTVVERVLALSPLPEGLRFVPVTEWGDSSAFR